MPFIFQAYLIYKLLHRSTHVINKSIIQIQNNKQEQINKLNINIHNQTHIVLYTYNNEKQYTFKLNL